jgi:hypothetical protein
VIQRTLDEIGEDIFVLVLGLQEGLQPLHHQLLTAFWEEEFDTPWSALKSTQKRAPPPSRKIHAFLARSEAVTSRLLRRLTAPSARRTLGTSMPQHRTSWTSMAVDHRISTLAEWLEHPGRQTTLRTRATILPQPLITDSSSPSLGNGEIKREVSEFVRHFEKECGTNFFSGTKPSTLTQRPFLNCSRIARRMTA